MLTKEQKDMILGVLSQIQFKVGESEVAKKFESIVEELKKEE